MALFIEGPYSILRSRETEITGDKIKKFDVFDIYNFVKILFFIDKKFSV